MPSNKASTEADILWPYLIRKVQRVAGIGGNGGGAGSIPRLATLGDVHLTSPLDGQVLTYDSVQQLWINEDPTGGGGGGSYTAGNGIAIAGTVIATKQKPNFGLGADANGLFIQKPANSGLTLDAGGLYVGDGFGISVLGDVVAVAPDELADGTQGIGVNSNKFVLKIDAAGGLVIDAQGELALALPDDLDYTTTNATTATGHTHNIISLNDVTASQSGLLHALGGDLKLKTLTLNGDLTFILGDRHITGSNSLWIQPATDLYLDPGGNVVYPDNQVARTPTFNDFIAGISGWMISNVAANEHLLTISDIKADQLFVHKFTADLARVQRGEWFLTKSYGTVETGFAEPAVNATVDVWFEEAPGMGNFALFEANDWIEFRTIDWSTGLLVQKVWFQAVGVGANGYITREDQTPTGSVAARQQWRLIRRQGGVTNAKIAKGEIGADFGLPQTAMPAGTPGQGTIYASSLYNPDHGPFIEIQTFESVVSAVPQFKNRVRMGNLETTVDYTAQAWGFAAADDLSILPSAGMSGFAVDSQQGARFFNTDLTMYSGGIQTLVVDRANGIGLRFDDVNADYDPLRMIQWMADLASPPATRNDPQSNLIATYYDQGGGRLIRDFQIENIADAAIHEEARIWIHASDYGSSLFAGMAVSTHTRLSTGGFGTSASLSAAEVYLSSKVIVGGQDFSVSGTDDLPVMQVYQQDVSGSPGKIDRFAGLTIKHQETSGASSFGDSVLHWRWRSASGAEDVFYSMGIDGSDSRKWKVSVGDKLGINDIIVYNPATGAVTITGFDPGGSTPPAGVSAGDGITVVGSTISVNATVARTVTQIIAGNGLGGGGTLAANVTLSVLTPAGSGLSVSAGGVSINDTLAGDGLSMAVGKIMAVNASVVRDPATVVRDSFLLNTTFPLTGGGDLSATRTLDLELAASGGLTVTSGLAVDSSVVRTTLPVNTTAPLAGGGALNGGLTLHLDLAATTPGLTMIGGGLSVDSSVVRTARQVVAGDGLQGGGDLSADRTLAVNATVVRTTRQVSTGNGLQGGGDLSADRTLSVLLPLNSGLVSDGTGLYLNSTLAGAGLAISAAHVLSVNASKGLMIGTGVDADNVIVDVNYPFTWLATHQFNANPKISANLDFIGADRTITGSANLTIQPAANLTLAPTGGIVTLPDVVEERSTTFADLVTGIQGFRLWSPTATTRQLTIATIKVDNLTAKAFTTDLVRLEQGDSYWGKGYGVVETSFNLPALSANVNVWFENVPNTAGQIFSVGDKLQCRIVIWTTGISLKTIWFNVAAYVSADDANFRQQWTLTRLSGGATGDLVAKGNVLEDAGAVGQGWIHVTSLKDAGGPYMEFGLQSSVAAGVPQFTQYVRIGQLTGTVDYGAGTAWGFATGNNLGLTPAGGFSGITVDNSVKGLRVFNSAYQLFNGANLVLAIDKTNGISMEASAPGTAAAAFNSLGWYADLGTDASVLGALLGSVGLQQLATPYTEMLVTAQGPSGAYTIGALWLRAIDAAAASQNIWLDSSGIYFGSGSSRKSQTAAYFKDSGAYLPGPLGIGTSAPAQLLHLRKDQNAGTIVLVENQTPGTDSQAQIQLTSQGTFGSFSKSSASLTAYKFLAPGDLSIYNHALRGDIDILNDYAGGAINLGAGAAATPHMAILPSGFVGIGTSAPGALLDVQAGVDGGAVSLRIANTFSATSSLDETAQLTFDFWATAQGGLRTAALIQAIKTLDWTTGPNRQARLAFFVSPSGATLPEIMTLMSSGFVGIGTTAPGVAVAGGYNYPTTNTLAHVRSSQAAVLLLEGDANGQLGVIDRGAASGQRWLQLVTDGGVATLRSLTDAAAVAATMFTASHVTGLVTFPNGINLGDTTLSTYIESATLNMGVTIGGVAASIVSRSGRYCRVGNRVDIGVNVTFTKGALTGAVLLTGLPYAALDFNATGAVWYQGMAGTANITYILVNTNANTTLIPYYAVSGGNNVAQLNATLLGTGNVQLFFSLTYFV